VSVSSALVIKPSLEAPPVKPLELVNITLFAVKVLPSKVKLASPSKVFAVPLPVITLLSALLFIVVPEIVEKAKVPLPLVVNA